MSDISRFEDKLDKMIDTQTKQEVNLGKLTVSVQDHIARTEILEAKIIPIEHHMVKTQELTKWIKILISSGALIEIIRFFK